MGHLVRARRRPSAAMVVAIIALVVAASGTAMAATKLVRGDSLIKKNSLSGNRLKNRSVTGSKIKLSSLGTVPRATLADSATNATDAANAVTAGSAPIAKLTYVTATVTVLGDGGTTTGTATCPAGTYVTGGGANVTDTQNGVLYASYPVGKTGWSAVVADYSGLVSVDDIYAICAPAVATAP